MNTPTENAVPSEFLAAYIECALWSSTYYPNEDSDDSENMDDGKHELADETRAKMAEDCAKFFARCEAAGIEPIPEYDCAQYSNAEKSGHDFWLTRNGHGAGYWDRGLGAVGDKLTELAEATGSADLYIGDDGLIYQA